MKFFARVSVFLVWLAAHGLAQAGSYDDFFVAMRQGDVQAVKSLLQRGFDPNTLAPNGDPAIVFAIRSDALPIAEVLIQAPKIRVEARTLQDESALMLAALKGHLAICQALVEHDADINKPGWTPLHYAATGGHLEVMRWLLDNHAYIDASSPNGTTPLMMAAMYGTNDGVQLLLEAGADPQIKNDKGLNAVDFAKQIQRDAAAKLISAAIDRLKATSAKP